VAYSPDATLALTIWAISRGSVILRDCVVRMGLSLCPYSIAHD
jgi:hypothetical protein